MSNLPDGSIARSPTSVFGDKVFFLSRGRRHWIRDGRWFEQNNYVWPDAVRVVEPEVLLSYRPAGPAPLRWSSEDYASPGAQLGSSDMREIAASRLVGMGIEVGPGASPFPIPLHCDVLYADRLSGSELVKELYRGQLREDLIEPDLLADLENPADIAESSVDFIVACHVIEHSRNPIGALAECWRRLKPRGQLVLVVPDMRKTFDRKRATTPLAHFILDFTEPSRERDRQHYEEFYRLAFETAPDKLASTVEAKYQEQYAIHYHTWTYESFGEMVSWVGQSTAPFSEVWSQPTRSDPQQDIEFYFVLTK